MINANSLIISAASWYDKNIIPKLSSKVLRTMSRVAVITATTDPHAALRMMNQLGAGDSGLSRLSSVLVGVMESQDADVVADALVKALDEEGGVKFSIEDSGADRDTKIVRSFTIQAEDVREIIANARNVAEAYADKE